MSRVQLASLGAGVAQTPSGVVVAGASGTIVYHDGSGPVPVYATETAVSPASVGSFVTDNLGRIPGWADAGVEVDITISPASTVTVDLGGIGGSGRSFTDLECSGDSYGQGVGSLDKVHGYNSILAAMLGVPIVNHSIGGAVAAWQKLGTGGGGDGGYANVLQDLTTLNDPGTAPYDSAGSLASLSYSNFNDMWDNGHTAAIGPAISAMRLIISRYRMGGHYGPTDASFSASTNFAQVASQTFGDGTSLLKSTGSPATRTWTVPADVPAGCTPVIYGQVWPDTVGTITFTKNGTAQPGNTITLANIANASGTANVVNGWCARFPTAVAGDVIVLTATYSAGFVGINGAMVEALTPRVVLVQNCPQVPIVATSYGWANTGAMQADIAAMNSAKQALCAEFDSKVIYHDIVPVLGSTPFGTAGSLYGSDNLHPTPDGHAAIALSALVLVEKAGPTDAVKSLVSRHPPKGTRGWTTLKDAPSNALLASAAATGTYTIRADGTVATPITNTSSGYPAFYLDPGDHGGTLRARVKAWVITNAVAQTGTFTFNLVQVATWGGASGSNPAIATTGSPLAAVAIAAPAAGAATEAVGASAVLLAAGFYVLELVISGAAVATNGQCFVGCKLEGQPL